MTDLEGQADSDGDTFYSRCADAWRELFETAKAKNELAFAFALFPEFRGMQDAGWNTAQDALVGMDDYLEVIEKLEWDRGRVRICLALYCHIFEASGLFEVPKNMLNVIEAGYFQIQPFRKIVRESRATGQAIAPNAKVVMQELLGHAKRLGFNQLVEVITASFNASVRHGYAHADYVILNEAIRFPQRNGGRAVELSCQDFISLLNKAIALFSALREVADQTLRRYVVPVKGVARMNEAQPAMRFTIEFDEARGSLSIRSTTS